MAKRTIDLPRVAQYFEDRRAGERVDSVLRKLSEQLTDFQAADATSVGGIPSASLGTTGLFFQTFENDIESTWNLREGVVADIDYVNSGQTGGRALEATGNNNHTWIAFPENIPYEPDRLYRIKARVRQTARSSGGNDGFSFGVEGIAADGATLVDVNGASNYTSQHFVGADNKDMGAELLNDWVLIKSYFKGHAATGETGTKPSDDPNALHDDVRYIRPVFLLNQSGGDGTMEIDFISIEIVTEDPGNLSNSGPATVQDDLTVEGNFINFADSSARFRMGVTDRADIHWDEVSKTLTWEEVGVATRMSLDIGTGDLTLTGSATFDALVIGTDPGGSELLRVGGDARVGGSLVVTASDPATFVVQSTGLNSKAFLRVQNDTIRWAIETEGAANDNLRFRDEDNNAVALQLSPGASPGVAVVNDLDVGGDLVVSGTGPHVLGGVAQGKHALTLRGAFTSDGSSTNAAGMAVRTDLTLATGDTLFGSLIYAGAAIGSSITTQGAAETISQVATATFGEPGIVVGTGDTITTAATLIIEDAPTEGGTNYAAWIKGANAVTRIEGTLSVGAIEDLEAPGSLRGWVHDMVFTADDNDTVSWSAGTIELPDGTTYSITGGNTGNMVAVTYIYLDTDVSTTALQTSTNRSDAVGSKEILVAVAENVADTSKDAEFQVFGGGGAGQASSALFTKENIAADTLTANEVDANTLTATEIASLLFSGKQAEFDQGIIGGWTIGATQLSNGSFVLDASGEQVRIGTATGFDPATGGTGIIFGLEAGTDYDFRIGSSTDYLWWDASVPQLKIQGASVIASRIESASGDFVLAADDEEILIDLTGFESGTGIFLGIDGGVPKFQVGGAGSDFLKYDGTGVMADALSVRNGLTGLEAAGEATTVMQLRNWRLTFTAGFGDPERGSISHVNTTGEEGLKAYHSAASDFTFRIEGRLKVLEADNDIIELQDPNTDISTSTYDWSYIEWRDVDGDRDWLFGRDTSGNLVVYRDGPGKTWWWDTNNNPHLDVVGQQLYYHHDSDTGNDRVLWWVYKDGSETWALRHDYDSEDLILDGSGASDGFGSTVVVKKVAPYMDFVDTRTGTWDDGDSFSGIRFRTEDGGLGAAGSPDTQAYIIAQHARSGTGHGDPDAGLVFGTSSGNTPARTVMVLDHAGSLILEEGNLIIQDGQKFYLDGGGDTYIDHTPGYIRLVDDGVVGLEVNGGDVDVPNAGSTSGGDTARLDGSGTIKRFSSSERWKEHKRDLSAEEARKIVMGIGPTAHWYKSLAGDDDGRRRFLGFTAEQVDSVDSKLATHDENGLPRGILFEGVYAAGLRLLAWHERRIKKLENALTNR